MKQRSAFRKHDLQKAIDVAVEKGFRIGAVTARGEVLVYTGDERPAELSIVPDQPKKRGTSWDDV